MVTVSQTYPWLVKKAVEFLEEYLTKDMTVLEYGSGISTKWIAERVKHIYSIEHSQGYYDEIREKLKGYDNVTLIHHKRPYNGAVLKRKFDFILVDGRDRVKCFREAVKMLLPNGVIMLDDSQRPEYEECYDLAKGKVFEANGPNYTEDFNYQDWKTTWWI